MRRYAQLQMDFNLEIKGVEEVLTAMISLFPSTSDIALVHEAEQKLQVALHMWKTGHPDLTTALAVDACADLYALIRSLLV